MRVPWLIVLAAALSSSPALAGGDDAKGGAPKGGSAGGGKTPGKEPEKEKDWSDHKGDIPFIVGRERGMKEVAFTGKPILFFYTATW
jgi:Cu/Zn superoxide dismutase